MPSARLAVNRCIDCGAVCGATRLRSPRLVADKLSKKWGQGVVVDNKAGANGIIGTEMIAKAAPDGYTIPYKGSSSAHPDLLANQVQVMFDAVAAVTPHVKSGRLELLAVCGASRAALWPDVPTLAQAGVKGYAMTSWGGIIAPAKLPVPIAQKLNRDIVEALNQPDVRDKLVSMGADVVAGTPEHFDTLLRNETQRYGKLIKDVGLVPQ